MGVYTVELDSGGQYITEAAKVISGAIGTKMREKADRPIMTEQLIKKFLAEGQDLGPREMWQKLTGVMPKANRDQFELIYFGRVLTAEERAAVDQTGFLPGTGTNVQSGGAAAAPVTAVPSSPGVSPPVPSATAAPTAEPDLTVFGSLAEGAIKGKAVEASPTGGIAPTTTQGVVANAAVGTPQVAPTGDATDDSKPFIPGTPAATEAKPSVLPKIGNATVDAAIDAASAIVNETADESLADLKGIQSSDDMVASFQRDVAAGNLTPKRLDYYMELAGKDMDDFKGRINRYLGYDPYEKLNKYGMSPYAQRMVINGMVSQMAGIRDLTKENAVLRTQIHTLAKDWATLDQNDRKLAAEVIQMGYGLKAQLRGQDINQIMDESRIELDKLKVKNDTVELILSVAKMADTAAGSSGATSKNGASLSDRWVAHSQEIDAVAKRREEIKKLYSPNSEAYRAAMTDLQNKEKAMWFAMLKEDPDLGLMVMAYASSAETYRTGETFQIMNQFFGEVPGLTEALNAAAIAPNTAQRQAALLQAYAKVDPVVQNWINTKPAEVQATYRQVWKLTMNKGIQAMMMDNVAEQVQATQSVPQGFAISEAGFERPNNPPTATVGSQVVNDIATARAGAATGGSGGDVPAGALIGVPKSSDNANTQKQFAGSIVQYSKEMSDKYKVDLDPRLMASIIDQESNWNREATSPKDARGLMQLREDAAKDVGVRDRFNPTENIRGGIEYFAMLLKRYNGDTKKALAAYNWGMGNFDEYLANPAGGLPGKVQAYVDGVMNFYKERTTTRGV